MKVFYNLVIMMVLEILITNYIFNMLEHKVKDVHLVEDLHLNIEYILNIKLSQLTECCTNVYIFKRLLDNESFFLLKKCYYD